ncbi:MAG: dTMP kinase [Erysipelotrichaceae bacterium]|nr:dTMP kinase [Erysipelotrichaceae bacterium]
MGLFITIEGPEGSGKTTVAKRLVDTLNKQGIKTIYSREPGGVIIAEKIRNIILDVENTNLDPRSEALLYAASRRQHLVEKVIPALNDGYVVICDRFVDSSLAYQGYARGIGIDEIYDINLFAINNLWPDMTILLDIDPKIGLERISANRQDEVNRLDLEGIAFHQKVHEGYEIIKEKYKDRFTLVDGNNTKEKVFADVYSLVMEKIHGN